MPWIDSTIMPTDTRSKEWWYNSLDAAVTLEIYNVFQGWNEGQATYNFERSLQGPALDMMVRGFLVDQPYRSHMTRVFEKRLAKLESMLNRISFAMWGKDLNPRSPTQLREYFYSAMGLPEIWTSKKGVRSLSTDREALEKLSTYWIARPAITLILAARDCSKKLGVLRSGVDPDGRLRCTYNVCGTETGRWASSKNVWGRGTNLQNITPELRRLLIADPNYILVYVDGEQAESHAVGFIHWRLFRDGRYLDACEAGDLHTSVSKLVWPHKEWTGDRAKDRDLAESPFYRHFSFRDMAKRGGHATNYFGKPFQISRQLKVERDVVEQFQFAYFSAFPAMSRWHTWVAEQLVKTSNITTFVGRSRDFYGRADDDATLRSAIAYEPQSVVGDLINEGGYRVWRQYPEAQVLAQQHDAYVFQIPITRPDLVDKIKALFEVPITSYGRTMTIKAEAKVGFNFAECETSKPIEKRKFRDGNPDGLRKWTGSFPATRTESPTMSLLDRRFC